MAHTISGYSYPFVGGNTQYAVVPKVVLERGCLLPYHGDSYFAEKSTIQAPLPQARTEEIAKWQHRKI